MFDFTLNRTVLRTQSILPDDHVTFQPMPTLPPDQTLTYWIPLKECQAVRPQPSLQFCTVNSPYILMKALDVSRNCTVSILPSSVTSG
ncbi:hypothetical protein E2C01_003475 [Portunus trituberculatus]|uniref:Uncharacterized protein n=1 Tax=Portunus trituberculatus TaxID=210409 RepID=A0A5B7CPV6_PORTR|nr:hypothetical protein [Portunus trituberculatus]